MYELRHNNKIHIIDAIQRRNILFSEFLTNNEDIYSV